MLNNEQTKSMVRMGIGWVFAGVIGTWLGKHGVTIDENFMTWAAVVVTGASEIAWKLFNHAQQSQVAKAAALVYISPEQQKTVGLDVPIEPEPKGVVLRDGGVILLLILLALGAGGFLLKDKLPLAGLKVTTNQLYVAESTYAIALTAADHYRIACVGDPRTGAKPVLVRSSCEPIVVKIQSAVRLSDQAYRVVLTYEKNPPEGAIQAFKAAVDLLRVTIPVTYLTGGAA